MEQQTLFHEDINDALRSAVKACGGTKAVAVRLWPEKTVGDAQSYLNDCLNSARAAKLGQEQVMLLLKWAKRAGYHDAIKYICAECEYTAPEPIDPEDEKARLQREVLEAVNDLRTLLPKLEQAQAKLKAVG